MRGRREEERRGRRKIVGLKVERIGKGGQGRIGGREKEGDADDEKQDKRRRMGERREGEKNRERGGD